MVARWGEVLYRIAEIIAGLIAAFAFLTYLDSASAGEPIIPVVPLVLAGVILLIGRSCRELPSAS